MIAIACVLITFAHTCLAERMSLAEPMSLSILIQDLKQLRDEFPTAESWQESKIIQYPDDIEIEVTRDPDHYLVVSDIAIAKMEKTHQGQSSLSEPQTISKLLFKGGWIYFDDPNSQPAYAVDKHYIMEYESQFDPAKKPAIVYKTEAEFKTTLRSLVDGTNEMHHGSEVPTDVKSYDGHELNVLYDKNKEIWVVGGNFQVLIHSEHWEFIEKTAFEYLNCYIKRDTVCIEFMKLGVGRIFGVKIQS